MSPDQIATLILSKNPDDVRLGLEFIGSFRLREIKRMFPTGSVCYKGKHLLVNINCVLEEFLVTYYRMHHGLYISIWRNQIIFSSLYLGPYIPYYRNQKI